MKKEEGGFLTGGVRTYPAYPFGEASTFVDEYENGRRAVI